MLQIATIAVGVAAVAMGIKALMKGEVQLSRTTQLRQGSARVAGVITIVLGIVIVGFALVGIPLMMSR
jgi:cytochrome c biogenesis protein CcdA